ncbi:MAG: hypothetical protein AB7Q17_17800 [Phycisphaerae bacterium]
MTTKAFVLSEYRTVQDLVRALRALLTETESIAIFADHDMLGTLAGPRAMKEMLFERLMRRVAEDPDLIDRLSKGVEDDQIVD